MSFRGKVFIVTGASSGIGAAIAKAASAEGANVTLAARNVENLTKVANECKQLADGNQVHIVVADVAAAGSARRIINETLDKFNRIDVLVNNAGTVKFVSVTDKDYMEEYDRILNTNLRSAVELTHLAAPHLIKSKGNIVNISSIMSEVSRPYMSPYSVSKAGMDHFTRSAAVELASEGVRVNAINPGPVKTNIFASGFGEKAEEVFESFKTALNRTSEPKEVADLALFIAGDKGIGITGSCFVLDNGLLVKN